VKKFLFKQKYKKYFAFKMTSASSESSRLFCGHRALGYVSNHVPLVSRYITKRRENLIATSVGKSFHTYGGAKLGLLSVSGIHPEEITTMAAGKNKTNLL
jgi:hypothetical protein